MNGTEQECLTEQHLLLLGAAVHWFAKYEVLVQTVMAQPAETNLTCVTVLTRSLDFSEKRLALLDLLRVKAIPNDQWERVRSSDNVSYTLDDLR
jgi:hypothetical protein